MYGDNKDCPIRITSILSYNEKELEASAKRLMDQYGWKIHSRAKLVTINSTVYSIILFHEENKNG